MVVSAGTWKTFASLVYYRGANGFQPEVRCQRAARTWIFSSAGICCPELNSVCVGRHCAGRAPEAERCSLSAPGAAAAFAHTQTTVCSSHRECVLQGHVNEIRIGEAGLSLDVDIAEKFSSSLPERATLCIIILRMPFFPQRISCFTDLRSCFYSGQNLVSTVLIKYGSG